MKTYVSNNVDNFSSALRYVLTFSLMHTAEAPDNNGNRIVGRASPKAVLKPRSHCQISRAFFALENVFWCIL